MDVPLEDIEVESLVFDLLDADDMEFGDALERIILARNRYKKETQKTRLTSIINCMASKIEKWVNKELNINP